MSTMTMFRYVGHDRRGTGRGGQSLQGEMTPADFVEQVFRRGWRDLTVTDVSDGRVIGGIGLVGDTGHRTWWAES